MLSSMIDVSREMYRPPSELATVNPSKDAQDRMEMSSTVCSTDREDGTDDCAATTTCC